MITEVISGCGCCQLNVICTAKSNSCALISTFGSVDIKHFQTDPEDYSIGIFKFDVNQISDDNADIIVNGQTIGTVIGHVGPPPNCGSGQANGGLFLPQGMYSISEIPCNEDPCIHLNNYGIRIDPNNKIGSLIYNSSLLNNGKLINSVQVKLSTAIPSNNLCGNAFFTWVFKIKPAII